MSSSLPGVGEGLPLASKSADTETDVKLPISFGRGRGRGRVVEMGKADSERPGESVKNYARGRAVISERLRRRCKKNCNANILPNEDKAP